MTSYSKRWYTLWWTQSYKIRPKIVQNKKLSQSRLCVVIFLILWPNKIKVPSLCLAFSKTQKWTRTPWGSRERCPTRRSSPPGSSSTRTKAKIRRFVVVFDENKLSSTLLSSQLLASVWVCVARFSYSSQNPQAATYLHQHDNQRLFLSSFPLFWEFANS